jgi:CBS domain-containing protein
MEAAMTTSTSEEDLALSVPLRVRTLRVLGADGTVTRSSTVCCPRQNKSVRLRECIICGHGGRVSSNDAREPVMCCSDPSAWEPATPLDHGRGRSVAAQTALRDVMTLDVITVRDDLGIEALTGLLLEHAIHGVPVVDADGRPIGMVSRTDLVRDHFEHGCVEGQASPWSAMTGATGRRDGARPGPSAVVADLMQPMPITLREDASLSQAAALMTLEAIHRIPVVSNDGHVVGIITALDVAAWMARQDGYIA